jgi:AraC family transcriptional regulator
MDFVGGFTMLHQNIMPKVEAGLLAEAALRAPGELFGLLDHARRSLEEDPRTARVCLDRIAALFADPETEHGAGGALLPQMPAGANGRPVKGGLASWQLKRVVDHVEAVLDGSIPIETLAALTRLSAGHFCRAFKATVGETPHAFVIRQRIRRAQTLMLHSDDTLSRIAYACGLTDQAHLTRLFRKMVGDTPLAWRRTWRRPADQG